MTTIKTRIYSLMINDIQRGTAITYREKLSYCNALSQAIGCNLNTSIEYYEEFMQDYYNYLVEYSPFIDRSQV